MKPEIEPILLSVEDAAAFIGLAPRTIRKLSDDGVLKKVKLGARVLFAPDDLRAFVAKAKEKK